MKKIFFSILIILSIVSIITIVVLHNPAPVLSYVLSKVTGESVRISQIDYSYDSGVLSILLKNIHLAGNVEGNIENWKCTIETKKGFYFKDAIISNFNMIITGVQKKKLPYLPIPHERLMIKNGILVYGSNSFTIDEITAHNIKTHKSFSLSGTISSNMMRRLTFSGEGTYRKESLTMKGNFSMSAFDLVQLSPSIEGQINISGAFSYEKKVLTIRGPFEVSRCTIQDSLFKKPIHIGQTKGGLSLFYSGNLIQIYMSDIGYKGTNFLVNLTADHATLKELEISSGFFNIFEVIDNINFGHIDPALLSSLRHGKMRIQRLIYNSEKPFHAEIELSDIAITFNEKQLNNLGGLLTINEHYIKLTNVQATYGVGSKFYNFSGIIPLEKKETIKIKGNFSISLRDIPSFIDVANLQFKSGTTYGTIKIEGKLGEKFGISGGGTLTNSIVRWKKICIVARGSYTFTDNTILFNPLRLQKGDTDISVKGKWSKEFMNVTVKGNIDPGLLRYFVSIPFDAFGSIPVDIAAVKRQGEVSTMVKGTIMMDTLSFELPGVMKKPNDIKSSLKFAFLIKDSDISIEHFNFTLDTLNVMLTGKINDYQKIDCDVTAKADTLNNIRPMFFFDREDEEGYIDIRLKIRDLVLPIKKLPVLYGTINIKNGFLRLPWLVKPIRNFNLSSRFQDNTWEIGIEKLICGNSILTEGTLLLKDFESRLFFLSLTMENIDSNDFLYKIPVETFIIPTIHEGSFMSGLNSNISIYIKRFTMGAIEGDTLLMSGAFGDRKLSISEMRTNIFDGNFNFNGIIDFSAPNVTIIADGRLDKIKGGLFLSALGDTSGLFESRASLFGNINACGNDINALLSSLNGKVTLYSRNGVIKKWNLLSKIFGFLNVTDMVKGEINFGKEGLSYTRIGSNFIIQKGILHTDDFIIDSPSMLIHGKGDIDISRNYLDGIIAVSPLVTIDRIIDKIPLIRNILREKDKGFIYASYSVKGPINDPAITMNVMKTVGGRTVDVLKNIFKLPVEVFEK